MNGMVELVFEVELGWYRQSKNEEISFLVSMNSGLQ